MSHPSEPARHTLRPHERLKRPADFQQVYDHRRSVADERLIVYGRPNGLPHNRVGFSVSRKKFARAVRRNRVRRLLREAYRLSKPDLPGGMDLVFIPRSANAEFTLEELCKSVVNLVNGLARRLGREAEKPA
ncbi:MAG TPA: ribonuclease P protein component [Gemmataceae bacterium]